MTETQERPDLGHGFRPEWCYARLTEHGIKIWERKVVWVWCAEAGRFCLEAAPESDATPPPHVVLHVVDVEVFDRTGIFSSRRFDDAVDDLARSLEGQGGFVGMLGSAAGKVRNSPNFDTFRTWKGRIELELAYPDGNIPFFSQKSSLSRAHANVIVRSRDGKRWLLLELWH